MRSIILTFVSILIVGIIFGIILILVGGKCTSGDPSCDNNTASYQQNKYNNKWLNNNNYVIKYPDDTSRYFMLRGKKDFSTLSETTTYQPVIDSIDNCANYLTLQTDDNNYFIESSGLNANNLTCRIKHIDYNSDIRGGNIKNNTNMITIVNGTDSNDTFFYKGLIDYALLAPNGDICINNYNNCMRNKLGDKTADSTCKIQAWKDTYGNTTSQPNSDIPCGYVNNNDSHYQTYDKNKKGDIMMCAQRMKDKNMDMATFDKAALIGTNNCYYTNFPSGNPYNYLIFRK